MTTPGICMCCADKDTFRSNVLNLGVIAEPSEIDDVFSSIETGRVGSVGTSEVQKALKKFHQDAEDTRQEVRGMEKSTAELAKRIFAAQEEWRAQLMADEKHETNKSSHREKLANIKLLAVQEAKLAKISAIEAKRQGASADQAAFDARGTVKRSPGVAPKRMKRGPPSATRSRADTVLATAALMVATASPVSMAEVAQSPATASPGDALSQPEETDAFQS